MKAARVAANLTQECVAELVGVHWQTISYLEAGKSPFSIVTFARLSQALETSPNRLMDGLPDADRARAERIKKVKARKRVPRKKGA